MTARKDEERMSGKKEEIDRDSTREKERLTEMK